MTKDELITELAKHEELVSTNAPDTFLQHDENFDNKHVFFRPVSDDVVLMTIGLKASNAQARTTGLHILDLAQAEQKKIVGRVTTKLSGLNSGLSQFDHLIALCPEIKTSSPLAGARYLISMVIRCAAICNCEFVGDEGLVEARARLRHVKMNDMQRKIVPVVNERHRFDDGTKSKQKFLGVVRESYLEDQIKKLPELGGVVEMENYERTGCVFTGKAGEDTIEVTLEGQTKAVSLSHALSFLDPLLRQGADAARKVL
jgi:hypothetical protein